MFFLLGQAADVATAVQKALDTSQGRQDTTYLALVMVLFCFLLLAGAFWLIIRHIFPQLMASGEKMLTGFKEELKLEREANERTNSQMRMAFQSSLGEVVQSQKQMMSDYASRVEQMLTQVCKATAECSENSRHV